MPITIMAKLLSRSISILVFIAALSEIVLGQSFQWRNITPQSGTQPEARRYGSAIYDAVGRQIIVFGGLGTSGFLNDLWSFDLNTQKWSRLEASGAPSPRFGHNAVYDSVGRQMVVWAGQESGKFYNDTWILDLQSMVWRNVSPAQRPKARYGSASVFDPTSRSLVQFAGFTEESVRYQDTQSFDIRTLTWTDITPASILPEVRCLLTAAFDRTGRRMLIFGGQRAGPLGDFWSFDLQSRRWNALNTTQGPSPRFFSTSFVNTDGSFVLFGGSSFTGNLNDTWMYRFDTGQWAQIQTENAPSPRSGMMGAYVESEGRFIIFGGSGNELLNDVWEFSRVTSPVETNSGTPAKAAVVIVNSGSQPANISFVFTDAEGLDLAPGVATIPSNGQLAQFLDQPPFNVPPSFQGTLTIQSSLPISVSALTSFVNPDLEFAASSLPVIDLASPPRNSTILPLITDGGGWNTRIILVNPTDQAMMGSVQFPSAESGVAYVIPARSARTLQRLPSATTQTNWARISPAEGQAAPAGFAIVSFAKEKVSGTHTSFAAAPQSTAFRIYVENR